METTIHEPQPPELYGLGPDMLRFNRLIENRELLTSDLPTKQRLTLACGHVLEAATPVPDSTHYLPCGECLAAWLDASPAERTTISPEAQEIHRKRHLDLHTAYTELMADFLAHNKTRFPSQVTLAELLHWSYAQTLSPDGFDHLTGGRYFFGRSFGSEKR